MIAPMPQAPQSETLQVLAHQLNNEGLKRPVMMYENHKVLCHLSGGLFKSINLNLTVIS